MGTSFSCNALHCCSQRNSSMTMKTGCGLRSAQVTPAKRSAASFSFPCRHNGIVSNSSQELHARCRAPYSACRCTMKPCRQTMRGRSPRPVTTYGGQSFTAKEPVKRAVVVTGFEPAPAGSCVLCSTDELHNRAISTFRRQNPYTEHTVSDSLDRDTARRRPGRCSSPESIIRP